MKQLFKPLLTALLLLCSIVVSAKEKCAATDGWKEFTNIVEVDEKCGDNIYWSFDDETGKLTIYGEGEMYHDSWYGSSVPWKSEKSNIKSVDILEGVTNVGSWSFQGCDALTSVTLPNSITDIGEYAFMGCSKLTNITIPNSATTIGGWGFNGCKSLTNIVIPDNVNSIGEGSFQECTGLNSIILPKTLTNIGLQSFYNCNALTSIISNIPADKLFVLGNNTFSNLGEGCTLYVPAGAKATYQATDGWKEFTNIVEFNGQCGENLYWEFDFENKSLNFTGSGEMLIEGARDYRDCPWYAFANITEKINLSEGMTNISYAAFAYFKKIKEIEIPASVIKIEGNTDFYLAIFFGADKMPYQYTPFTGCSSLKKITVTSGNPVYCGENNAIIEKNTRRLVVGCNGTIIPHNISVIGACAFMECDSITSINIPYGVREIEVAAFNQMPMLESVTIPNSVRSIGFAAFIGAKCTEFNIPSSVKYIGEQAFYNTGWYNNQPDGLLRIDDCIVGYKGEYPTTLNFDKDVRFIVPGYYYRSLQTLTIDAENPYLYSPENSNVIIDRETNTLVVASDNSVIPNSVTAIGSCAFQGYNITSIEIPSSVKSIEYGAFERCNDLENIILHDGLINIGDYAFCTCYRSLKSITIPNSVTTIGKEAFSGCSNLESITIGSGVTKISKKAFGYNRKLTTVTSHIPADKLFAIESNVFENIDLTKVTLYVPAGAKATYQTTDGWKEFTNIVEEEYRIFNDGEEYTSNTDVQCARIVYNRSFGHTQWQALYVPFAIDYEVLKDEFTVAEINDINQYDDDGDGVADRTTLEIFKISSGTLDANYPYMIRPKTAGDKSIIIDNTVLEAAQNTVIDCSSVKTKFYFVGTHTTIPGSEMFENNYYALSGGSLAQASSSNVTLKPGRWYMKVESRTGAPIARSIEIQLIDEITGVDEIETTEQPEENIYYDLSGRQVENPTRGIYILNGKKVFIK